MTGGAAAAGAAAGGAAAGGTAAGAPCRLAPAAALGRRARGPAAASAGEAVGALADAWSVASNGLPPQLAGVEQQLFQAGLVPYLAYLWFLGQEDTRAPPLANFGARFLLLFVFATIPAGIAAKAQFGDVLANVDVLHGSSESLLTFSNLFFALGFARALAMPAGQGARSDGGVPLKAAGALAGVALAGCGLAYLGGPQLLEAADLAREPANALSLPTWAVHVSSVTEWTAAMGLVWAYAEHSGNQKWKGLTWAMAPFLASGLSACTFHTFYNNYDVGALVPLQALLTLTGNSACAFAAYRIWAEGKQLGEPAPAPAPAAAAAAAAGGASPGDASPGEPAPDGSLGPLAGGKSEMSLAVKLGLWSASLAFAVKYGELLAGDFAFQPNYPVTLAMVLLPTGLLTWNITRDKGEGGGLSMADVKSFGVAGTLSYVITELAFWAVAFPLAYSWYRVAEGSWLDLSNAADKAKLLGAGTVFINGVRLLVPVRLAAALALAPTVEKALKSAGVDLKKGEEGDGEGGAGAAAEAAEEKVKENA